MVSQAAAVMKIESLLALVLDSRTTEQEEGQESPCVRPSLQALGHASSVIVSENACLCFPPFIIRSNFDGWRLDAAGQSPTGTRYGTPTVSTRCLETKKAPKEA